MARPRIAVFSGPRPPSPTAEPLVTSNKARDQVRPAAQAPRRRQRDALRRASSASAWPRRSRSTSSSSAPIRWSPTPPSCTPRPMATSTPSGVFHREQRGDDDVPGVRDRASPGGWALPPAVHGAPGQWPALGGGLRRARRRGRVLPPAVLPRRLAHLRGDRPASVIGEDGMATCCPARPTSTSTAPRRPAATRRACRPTAHRRRQRRHRRPRSSAATSGRYRPATSRMSPPPEQLARLTNTVQRVAGLRRVRRRHLAGGQPVRRGDDPTGSTC